MKVNCGKTKEEIGVKTMVVIMKMKNL